MYTNAKLAILFHINNNFLFFFKKNGKNSKKLKKVVDIIPGRCYYNQVATRDERHKSFSNTDKY